MLIPLIHNSHVKLTAEWLEEICALNYYDPGKVYLYMVQVERDCNKRKSASRCIPHTAR